MFYARVATTKNLQNNFTFRPRLSHFNLRNDSMPSAHDLNRPGSREGTTHPRGCLRQPSEFIVGKPQPIRSANPGSPTGQVDQGKSEPAEGRRTLFAAQPPVETDWAGHRLAPVARMVVTSSR